MKTLYTAHAHTTAGREGHTETDSKNISLDLATPGGKRAGTNPEELFACGYSACFGSAVQLTAHMQKIQAGTVTVHADVSLNQDEQKGYSISAVLNVDVPGVDNATAQKLVEAAHQICPYSKATRGNIEVTLKANGQPLAKAA